MYSIRLFWNYIRYDIPRGVKNLWKFRKAVWNYKWYAGHGAVAPLLRTAISDMSVNKATYGYEADEPSFKKIAQMKRAVEILDCIIEDKFIDLAESQLGPLKSSLSSISFQPLSDNSNLYEMVDSAPEEDKAHDRKVYKRADELEDEYWNELCRIIQGQDYSKFDTSKDWNEQFDGTGLRGWWD